MLVLTQLHELQEIERINLCLAPRPACAEQPNLQGIEPFLRLRIRAWRGLRRAITGKWFDASAWRVALLLLSLLLVELLTRLVVVATLPLGQGRFYLGELVLIGRAEHEVGQQWLLLIGNMGFALLFFVLRVASRIPLMNYPFILGSAGSFGNLVEVNLRGAATDWIAIFPKVLPVAYNLGDFLIFAAIAWGAVNYVRLLLLAHRTGKLVADESSSV